MINPINEVKFLFFIKISKIFQFFNNVFIKIELSKKSCKNYDFTVTWTWNSCKTGKHAISILWSLCFKSVEYINGYGRKETLLSQVFQIYFGSNRVNLVLIFQLDNQVSKRLFVMFLLESGHRNRTKVSIQKCFLVVKWKSLV